MARTGKEKNPPNLTELNPSEIRTTTEEFTQSKLGKFTKYCLQKSRYLQKSRRVICLFRTRFSLSAGQAVLPAHGNLNTRGWINLIRVKTDCMLKKPTITCIYIPNFFFFRDNP